MSSLLLPKEPPSDHLVHTRFWPNTIQVRHTTPILCDQGEGLSPARLGCWPCPQEQLRYPVVKRMDHAVIAIVCRSVRVTEPQPSQAKSLNPASITAHAYVTWLQGSMPDRGKEIIKAL